MVRSLATIGGWREVPFHRFEYGWARYESIYLILDGRRYRGPWRVIRDGKVIAQSDGFAITTGTEA